MVAQCLPFTVCLDANVSIFPSQERFFMQVFEDVSRGLPVLRVMVDLLLSSTTGCPSPVRGLWISFLLEPFPAFHGLASVCASSQPWSCGKQFPSSECFLKVPCMVAFQESPR